MNSLIVDIKTETSFDLFSNYFLDLEIAWKQSLPNFTDGELIRIFPEVREVIPQKLAELVELRTSITQTIKEMLTLIRGGVKDEFSIWFWREYTKVTKGPKLLEIDRQIGRFRGLRSLVNGKLSQNRLTRDKVQQALSVLIENVISPNVKLRKSGKTYVGLCPFHQEKTPSFYVYPNTNSFYCYGCQKGGDVIKYVELYQNLGFVDSVKWLIGGR